LDQLSKGGTNKYRDEEMDVLRDFTSGWTTPYLFFQTYIGIMTTWRVLFMLGDALNLFINVFLILMKFLFFSGDFSKKIFDGWLSELYFLLKKIPSY